MDTPSIDRWPGVGSESSRSWADSRTRYEDTVLSLVDALALRATGWVAPIQFRLAETDADREAIFRLRGAVVVEKGWMRPDELADGLETDEFDEDAVLIGAWEEGRLVATSRLLFPRPGLLLPTEAAYAIEVEPRGQVVDAGRFAIAREYTSLGHRLLAALVARTWMEVRARGFKVVAAAFASGPMMRVYERMGLKMTVLAPARRYWGEDRYPIRFDVVGAVPRLFERWANPASE